MNNEYDRQQEESTFVGYTIPNNKFSVHPPKYSNYTCYLFGGDEEFSPITWVPVEGKVPNAWVRFWMKVFFKCKWVKTDD